MLGGRIKVRPVDVRAGADAARTVGDGAFFARTGADTDLLVKATARGAEVLWQLRSLRSARVHSLEFSLPKGAALRANPAVPGGAQVISSGKSVLDIPPAVARDADGSDVPTRMTVRGDVLSVAVTLGSRTRLPVLVDPALNGVVRENFGDLYNPANPAQAGFPASVFQAQCSSPFTCLLGPPLWVAGNVSFGTAVGAFQVNAPGSAQIQRVDVDNAGFFNSPARLASFFAEIAPVAAGATSAWTTNGMNSASGGTLPFVPGPTQFGPLPFVFCAGHLPGATDAVRPGYCDPSAGVSGNHFRFGVVTTGAFAGGNYIASLGGVRLSLVDPGFPTQVAMTGVPTGWVNVAPSVSVSGRQGGLGMGAFSVTTGSSTLASHDLACYFDISSPTSGVGPTSIALPPCPANQVVASSFDLAQVSPSLGDGTYPLVGHAESITGANTPTAAQTLKLDRTKPTIELSGSLTAQDPAIPLSDPSYGLHIAASDGNSSIPRSGVVSVTVSVSNQTGPPDTQTFTNASCQPGNGGCSTTGMSADYAYTVAATKGGSHTVTVTATDAAGNTFTAPTFTFSTLTPINVDTRLLGLERYLQYDSTPTGPGSAAYVNLGNGNFVWQNRLLDNPGRGLNTFATLTYNDEAPLDAAGKLTGAGAYDEVGQGFSLAISGITRVNEPIAFSQSQAVLTDADGTQHVFTGDPSSQQLSLGTLSLLPTRYIAPPGVHLRLRRFATTGERTWAATRPDGVTYYFNDNGYATSIQDRNGNLLRYAYQFVLPPVLPGQLQAIVSQLTCTAAGLIAGIPPLLQAILSGLGINIPVCEPQLRTVTDATGRQVNVAYQSTGGRIDSISDHLGHITKFAYDPSGLYLTSVTQAYGTGDARSHRFGYSGPQGVSTHVDLLAICDPRSPAGEACGPSTVHTTQIQYATQRTAQTAGGAVMKLTDRNSHATLYGYADAQGQHYGQAVVKDALAHTTSYTFDGAARPTRITDPLGRKTGLDWDQAVNEPSHVTRAKDTAEQAITDYTYNPNGLLLTKKDPPTPDGQQHTTTLTYFDTAGNQLSGVAGGEDPAHQDYVSEVKSVTTPRGSLASGTYTTDFDYGTDGKGNLRNITMPATRNALTGNLERGVVHADYDSFGQLTLQRDETGNVTTLSSYDDNGFARQTIDPRGNNPQTNQGDPNSGRWLYRYDANGNLLQSVDPRGAGTGTPGPGVERTDAKFTTTYTYDALDRTRSAAIPRLSDSTRPLAQRFVTREWLYDVNDNVTTYADAKGSRKLEQVPTTDSSTTAFHATYDAMDQPLTQRTPQVAHDGDAAPSAEITEIGYDAVDRLTSVKAPMARNAAGDPTGPAGAYATLLDYDAAGQKASVTRQQVTSAGTTKLITSLAYDLRGNVTGVADPVHNAKAACRDLGPAAAAKTASCQRDAMVYDLADNLLHSTEDPAGLDLDTTYTYYEDDSLKTVTDPRGHTTETVYDERGQTRTVTNPAGDKAAWEYDLAGRLIKLTKPKGTDTPDIAGDYETTYSYDPNGQLTKETVPRRPGQYGPGTWATEYIRNAVGDATRITDPRGNAFDNTYFDTGELRTTQRPSWYAFAAPGAPDGVPEPGGPVGQATTAGGEPEITQLSYDEVVKRADEPEAPLPKTVGEGSFGQVPKAPVPGVMPRARLATFDYDNEMRLVSVANAHVNDSGQVHTTNTLKRDALGRVGSITQPLLSDPATGAVTAAMTRTWTYDRNGNVASLDTGDVSAGIAAVETYGYDQFDRLASSTLPGPASIGPETTRYAYDDNDNLKTATTPLGHTTTSGYDAVDRLVSRTNHLGERTGYGYDPAGNQTSVTTPRGMALPADQRGSYTTTSTYDPADRLKTVTDGLGHTTTYGYDRDGNQTSVTSPGAQASPSAPTVDRQVTRVFDGRDLPWRETTDDGLGNAATSQRTTVTEYDANGNLRRTVNPQGVDASGQPAVVDDGETPVTTSNNLNRYATVREYDPDGLVTRVSRPEGTGAGNDDHLFRTDFGYTGPGFIETVSLPYDASVGETPKSTAYNHYDNGWIRSASDPQHIAEGASDDVIQTLTYGYDHRGNQTSWKRDAILQGSQQPAQPSRAIIREFAADGTLTRRQATKGGAGEREYVYAHDADRRLRSSTTTVDPNADLQGDVETFAYDDADRLLRANDSRARNDTVLVYDADGNVATRRTDGTLQSDGSYAGGKSTTFTYDTLDRQQSMVVDPVIGADRASSFDYYPSGERMRVVDPNGVAHIDYFDAVGQITQKRRVKASGVDTSQTYAYDADGNRTRDEKGTEAYNSRDQLVSWTRTNGSSVSYVLNGAGAVLRSTDSAGSDVVNTVDGDRLERSVSTPTQGSATTRTFGYDGFGNLIRIHRVGDQASLDTTYVFDAFERLITSTDPGQSPSATSYGYDGLDRRDFQTIGGQTSAFGYVAATDDLSVERASDHTTSFDYDAGGERVGMQVDVGGVGSYRPYITDAQGSVQGLETSTGAPESGSEVRYTPYGEQDATPSSTIGKQNPYRFQGFYYDPTANAYDALAREYRPDIQRFLTQDRFEAAGGDLALARGSLTSDRYAFVAGNPTTMIELDGHCSDVCQGGGYDTKPGPGVRRRERAFRALTPAEQDASYRREAAGRQGPAPRFVVMPPLECDGCARNPLPEGLKLCGTPGCNIIHDPVSVDNSPRTLINTGRRDGGRIILIRRVGPGLGGLIVDPIPEQPDLTEGFTPSPPRNSILTNGHGDGGTGRNGDRQKSGDATKAGTEVGTDLVVRNPLSQHAIERMAERGITKGQVDAAIQKGTKYYDRRNGSIANVLEGGFASGRTLLVGTNPTTGRVTTVISSRRFNPGVQFEGSDRFVPVP